MPDETLTAPRHAVTGHDRAFGLRAHPEYEALCATLDEVAPRGRVTITITAAGPDSPGRWHGVLTVENVRTTDHREIAPNALTTRDLPLPLMANFETSSGHKGAHFAGAIETVTRVENRMEATGWWDSGEHGTEAARLVEEGVLRWVSVDLEVLASELIEVGVDMYDPWDDMFWSGKDREGFETILITTDDEYDWWERITEARIMGATLTPFPAFSQAVIAPEGRALPEVTADNGLPNLDALMAAGYQGPPPAACFEDPQLPGPTHLTVTSEGRVFGHLATWGQDHISIPGTFAPRSKAGYAYFRTGVVEAVDGEGNVVEVTTGALTMGTGHADRSARYRAAADHYDHTGTAVADVASGEDEYGIWLAGVLRPTATEEQVRVLKASDVSGDWRDVGGALELVAALVVNVAGFPIPRSLAAAAAQMVGPDDAVLYDGQVMSGFREGRQVSLVAAGVVPRDRTGAILHALARRIAGLEAVTDPLRGLALDQLVKRARG